MTNDLEKLTLDNICEGAAHEIFDREVDALLKNINDPNTANADTRTITLEFKFKPSSGMEFMQVEINSRTKFANIAGVESSAHLSRKGAVLEAYAAKKKQGSLFDNVSSIDEGGKKC